MANKKKKQPQSEQEIIEGNAELQRDYTEEVQENG